MPRLTIPDQPHHIIQRGNNRQALFTDERDFRFLLKLLMDTQHHGLEIHAYVLMTNHFHLLATPATAESLPKAMQMVGRNYVRYFNDTHSRTGTLWEGRYKGTIIESERYLLTCMAYIDLNPVRAGIVAKPEQYPWSSYAHNAGLKVDVLIQEHPLYWSLGNTPFAREAAYRDIIEGGIVKTDAQQLTSATLKGWALGSEEFIEELARSAPRRVKPLNKGRPFKVV